MPQHNVAPGANLRGANDLSASTPLAEPEALPQHLPLVPLFTERGRSDKPLFVSGSSRLSTFGANSFSYKEKFANHQTVLSNTVNARGNAQFIQRLIPADAKKATLRLSIEIVPSEIPAYLRDADGNYILDADGFKQVDGANSVIGNRMRWVLSEIPAGEFGQGQNKVGTLRPMDEGSSDDSTIYPCLDFEADYGNYGTNVGIRLSAPTTSTSDPIDLDDVEDIEAYIYRMQFVERSSATATPLVIPNESDERYVNFSFDEDAVSESTSVEFGITKQFETYFSKGSGTNPDSEAPFSSMNVYSGNISTVQQLIADAENAVTPGALTAAMANVIGACDPYGVPYVTLEVQGAVEGGISLTSTTSHYGIGGSDGDTSIENYDAMVADYFNNFENHPAMLMNIAEWPISTIWDSGFTRDTKDALLVPMGLRKDILSVIACQDVTRSANSSSEDSSIGISLRTAVSMYPESEYYGTSVVRAAIVPRCGTLINSDYKGILPMTIDLADKVAGYLGASDGKYKSSARFTEGDARQVSLLEDINVVYTNENVRNKDWANGLMYVQSYGRGSAFYPAFPSAFADKSSVLSSFMVALALAELEKVCFRSWRDLSGIETSKADFIEKSNQSIRDLTTGRFDDRYTIVPDTYFTKYDEAAGNSYSANIKLYANKSIYIGQFTISTYDAEDLT